MYCKEEKKKKPSVLVYSYTEHCSGAGVASWIIFLVFRQKTKKKNLSFFSCLPLHFIGNGICLYGICCPGINKARQPPLPPSLSCRSPLIVVSKSLIYRSRLCSVCPPPVPSRITFHPCYVFCRFPPPCHSVWGVAHFFTVRLISLVKQLPFPGPPTHTHTLILHCYSSRPVNLGEICKLLTFEINETPSSLPSP